MLRPPALHLPLAWAAPKRGPGSSGSAQHLALTPTQGSVPLIKSLGSLRAVPWLGSFDICGQQLGAAARPS